MNAQRRIGATVVGVAALVLWAAAGRAQADVFTIGNAPPGTVFFVQGQSFTPSVQGNAGTGTPTASPAGLVALTDFTIDFQDPTTAPAFLSIFDHEPTSAEAATGTNSLGIGTNVGGGKYDFLTPVDLSFNTKYFAVLPTSDSIFDGNGNPYTGGVDMFPRTAGGIVQEGFGDFDIGFSATFTSNPAVPEPSSLALLALGGLGLAGWRRWRKRATA